MRKLLMALLLVLPGAAQAEWKEVTTDHFLIYADDSDATLQKRAERLEAVHYLMLRANGLQDDPSPVRVKVYFFGDVSTVEKLAGVENAAGYYYPARGGAIAVVPATDDAQSVDTLYHEYAHHFMLQYFPAAYPAWYVEGWAELIGATSFEKKGVIGYGKVNNGRKAELDYGAWTPAGDLVSKPRSQLKQISKEAFYGQSWLLTHFLTLSPERSPKLRAYLTALGRGASQAEAATAFGDLGQLNKDLRAYFSKGVFEYKAVPMPEGLAANMKSRLLLPSEVGLMKDAIETQSGNTDEEEAALLLRLRKDTAKYADDPFALQLLGDAEMESKNYDAARSIADRLVAAPSPSARAYLLKADVEMHFAEDADDQHAAMILVRDWVNKANSANPDDPLPLVAYFDSFAAENKGPNKLAITGLREASRRLPQNDGLRFKLAAALASRGQTGDLAEAVSLLLPIAHAPHGGGDAKAAQEMINKITGHSDDGDDSEDDDAAPTESE